MKFSQLFLTTSILCMWTLIAPANQPQWMTDGPNIDGVSASFEVPIEAFATKLYVEVSMGGKPRRFVFDTGSPSMIDMSLVKELGLKVIGGNQGMDSHGALVESEVVQANLSIGGTEIKNLPMMAVNFSASLPTKTFIGDGVLGSDLFPLGAWQFDMKKSVLRFNTSLKDLPHTSNSEKLKLYQFGYPYMPIFDVKFAKNARSKAMFDTGSPTLFAISSADLKGAQQGSGVTDIVYGYGSPGTSLGGQAADTKLLQVALKNFSIGDLKLGRIVAKGRDLSPSLIGVKILENYIITVDSRSQQAYFKEYSDEIAPASSFGFNLAFNDTISIGAVWQDSPAQAAGLTPGIQLISINGEAVEFNQDGFYRAIDAMQADQIVLGWKTGSAKLVREYIFAKE